MTVDIGSIVQVQRYSIHDGDGVRTTIFLAGCHLRCRWCANPESWTKGKKLAFYRHLCKGCERCIEVCPEGLDPRAIKYPNNRCTLCGNCVSACPHHALEMACQDVEASRTAKEIERDALFFRYTGGGVTFSGGEPFLQDQFIRSMARKFFDSGISLWVETCGYFEWDKAKDVVEMMDHVFLDIKCMDPDRHRQNTGVSNDLILQNAVKIHSLGIPMTIRIPAINEVNMDVENLEATAKFIAMNLKKADVELLPYHELGKVKYISFGMEDAFHSFTTPSKEEIETAYAVFRSFGIAIAEDR